MNVNGKRKKNQVVTANIFEQQELLKKAEVIRENLTASTWRELETNGKFDKNEKLSFISDDMLILGCDVGSEIHYLRAIDTRGRELSKSAFSFSNESEGFQSAKEWAVKIAAEHNKNQIVLGLEPTGHYWFCLATLVLCQEKVQTKCNQFYLFLAKFNLLFLPHSPQGFSDILPHSHLEINIHNGCNEYLLWYNTKRIKTSLGNMSLWEYRQRLGLVA